MSRDGKGQRAENARTCGEMDSLHDKVMQAAFGGMPASAYKPELWLVAEVLAPREPRRSLPSSLTPGQVGGSVT